jgi:hypothetical protein
VSPPVLPGGLAPGTLLANVGGVLGAWLRPPIALAAPLEQAASGALPVPALAISNAHPLAGASVTITNRSRDAAGHPLGATLTVAGQPAQTLGADQGVSVTLSSSSDVLIGLTATDPSGGQLSFVRTVTFTVVPSATPTLTSTPTATPTPVPTPAAFTGTLANGNVLVSMDGSEVEVHTATGELLGLLHTPAGPAPNINTGMAFDRSGTLYVTDFSNFTVSKFDAHGQAVGSLGGSWAGIGFPESIVFDAAGNANQGTEHGSSGLDVPAPIRKFDPAGNLVGSFAVAHEDRGSDWIDLANDQCTILYTSEGQAVKRFNVCTNSQLTDLTPVNLTGSHAYALRSLPSGGVIVAATEHIFRLDASGNVVSTYDAPGESAWFAVTLDPDGTSFWSASIASGKVYRFSIDSGAQIASFAARRPGPGGLTVVGEHTAALSTGFPTVTPAATVTATPTPTSQLATATTSPTPTPTPTPSPTPTLGAPDFTLLVSPAAQVLAPGGSANMTLNIAALNGFNSAITLSAAGLPAGVSAVFNPATLIGFGLSTLTLTATADAAAGGGDGKRSLGHAGGISSCRQGQR